MKNIKILGTALASYISNFLTLRANRYHECHLLTRFPAQAPFSQASGYGPGKHRAHSLTSALLTEKLIPSWHSSLKIIVP